MRMENNLLLACIEAEIKGEKVEYKRYDENRWAQKIRKGWNTYMYDYRIAPQKTKLVPHWPAIFADKNGRYYISGELYPDTQSAKTIFVNFVRLAVEYPPIMLEVKE